MFKKTRKYLLIGLFLLWGVNLFSAPVKKLSEQAQISILIGEPSNKELFSMFGHAALRITDPQLNVDYVFHYGIPQFPTGLVNFIRLFKNLRSELYAIPYSEINTEYVNSERSLNELVLNFSQEEKESLWQSLLKAAQSNGKNSYYNILSHNCTALPLRLLEENTAGTICWAKEDADETYRSFCNQCLQIHPWSRFLLNISLGRTTDRPITYRESFFLPRNLEKGLLSANVVNSPEDVHPLIAGSHYLVSPVEKNVTAPFFTPLLCGWLLLAIVLIVSGIEWKHKRPLRWIDALLFGVAGIGGLYLFYIQFMAIQWFSSPSWWILWLHPLHLLAAVLSGIKRFDRLAAYYHTLNLAALIVMSAGLLVIPQYCDPAFVPLILLLALRSVIRMALWKKSKKIDTSF